MQQEQMKSSVPAGVAAASEKTGTPEASGAVTLSDCPAGEGEPPVTPILVTADPLAHVRQASRFVIIGQTQDGRSFRPSDWAERLAGVMAEFRPKKKTGARSGVGRFHLGYSPYVLPSMYHGFKCVIVDRRLHDIEPLAHHFVLNFALDNQLRTEVLE